MSTMFTKYLVKDSVLEISVKDSVLYVKIDDEYLMPLYYFKRINQNRLYPIKKNHVFISSVGYYEFYKNKKLRIGAAGPETIWKKQ